jgi:RNA polymerase sigma-70 factor (ECF subfamily)
MRRDHLWIEDEAGRVSAPEDRIDESEPADEALARRQEADALARAIDGLPEGARRALRLYRFEGLGQSEIAAKLGISRSGVEKHLALAMRRLRDALADCGSFAAAASEDEQARRGGESRKDQGR